MVEACVLVADFEVFVCFAITVIVLEIAHFDFWGSALAFDPLRAEANLGACAGSYAHNGDFTWDSRFEVFIY